MELDINIVAALPWSVRDWTTDHVQPILPDRVPYVDYQSYGS